MRQDSRGFNRKAKNISPPVASGINNLYLIPEPGDGTVAPPGVTTLVVKGDAPDLAWEIKKHEDYKP